MLKIFIDSGYNMAVLKNSKGGNTNVKIRYTIIIVRAIATSFKVVPLSALYLF